MVALAYLLSVAVSLGALAVLLRRRPAPAPAPAPPTPERPAPAPTLAVLPPGAAEVHVILAAATQLAARLDPAA